jgi:hypothetical protein
VFELSHHQKLHPSQQAGRTWPGHPKNVIVSLSVELLLHKFPFWHLLIINSQLAKCRSGTEKMQLFLPASLVVLGGMQLQH